MERESPETRMSRFRLFRCLTRCEADLQVGNGDGAMNRKLIGVVGFDGVKMLDLTSPLETFATARIGDGVARQSCYDIMIVSATGKNFVSESGISFKAEKTIDTAPAFDTIVIPGGKGVRQPETGRKVATWLASQAARTRRFAAVSTGVYALAESGLLHGRSVTTHWRFVQDLARRFPTLRVTNTAAFLKDGAFYSSGGGTAGIEMALALIEEDFGSQTALAIAREFVMTLRPAGSSENQIDASEYQPAPMDRLADLPAWIVAHLREHLSVEVLAERSCVCPRHFSRLFRRMFKSTPADFVEQLRLSEAGRRLLTGRNSVQSVASAVGFASADAFRRAFERRYGITPSRFRNRQIAAAIESGPRVATDTSAPSRFESATASTTR
jgi:transcriptional regulator GlxA family with amidase domain